MKKSRKAAVITAAVCIAAGLIISLAAMFSAGFDFSKFNTDTLNEKVYTVSDEFSNIEINCAEFNIQILPSQDETCKITSWEGKNPENSVDVENGTLKIKSISKRKWYEHISIMIGQSRTVTIYLPKRDGAYGALSANSAGGNITLSSELEFNSVKLISVSGDISAEFSKADSLHLQSTSGNVKAGGLAAASLTAKSTSGDIRLLDINAIKAIATSVSGNITLENFTAKETAQAAATSGDIKLKGFDANIYDLKTVSGNIKGTVKSPKSFKTSTVSGNVDVPDIPDLSICSASTTSGDIKITVEQKKS